MNPYDLLITPFIEFDFMKRALLGGLALSISAPPIGIFLTLRRMSLAGDAMTHAILPGAALGYLAVGLSVTLMTISGLLTGLAVVLLSGFAAQKTLMKEDASFASFHLIAFALGVALISLRGSPADLLHILFGSILALDDTALILLTSVAIISLCGMAIIFRPLVMDSVDPEFLQLSNGHRGGIRSLFLILAVLNLTAGFHALGTLMAIGLMILPAVSARFWSNDLSTMIPASMIIAVLSVWGGLISSYQFDLPSGSSIILTAGFFHAVSIVIGGHGGLLWKNGFSYPFKTKKEHTE